MEDGDREKFGEWKFTEGEVLGRYGGMCARFVGIAGQDAAVKIFRR